ncbi:hypothetical protein SEPCBS57363_004826 [Sporothrix epigloea]|uniref:Uncharacterized protein n=1 Tax=Sporothrix epigloea TaxID=1892477 RepID=A0ABP0DU59_9PEZI
MADPDNFDDELFADLYNDDEPQAPKAPSAPISQPSIPTKEPAPPVLEPASHDDQGGEYDDSMRYDDEDDEVDFHLGNGSSSNNKAGDPTTGTSFIPIGNHQIEETPQASSGGNDFQLPAQSELHNKVGSNSKEDG